MASVTLTLTSYSSGVGNFTIYHTSIDSNNIIAQNVSTATLAAGFCTEEIYSTYIVQSNTENCDTVQYINIGPTPTPGPTSTPGVTETPTPTASPTATSLFPTPSPTPGGPSPTPLPPTPTPTATVPAGVFGIGISSGSIDADSCGNVVTGSVYADTDPTDWEEYTVRIYQDTGLNNAFPGGNKYYHFIADGFNEVWSVNDTGLVSVSGSVCDPVTTFYATVANNTFEDPCTDPATIAVYSMDFTTVTEMTNGAVIYTSPSLTTQLRDGWLYAIADTYDGTANKRSFEYSVNSGVNSISLCSTPTPVPTSTPTATPFVSYQYFLTSGSVNNNECNDTVGALSVYSDIPNPANFVDFDTVLYTDANLTIPFDGNDLWYGINSGSGLGATYTVFVNNNTGLISDTFDCGDLPPTPTPTLPIYRLYGNQGYTTSGNECYATVGISYFTQAASSSAGIQAGDRIYKFDDLSLELSDGEYYGLADTSGSAPEISFEYTQSTGVVSVTTCTGSISSASVSSYHLNFTDACNDTTPEFTVYFSPNVDVYNLQAGDVLYEDTALTDYFGNNNLYYGIYSGSQTSPVIAYQLYTGSAKNTFSCPTPTATPTPTPSPTPFIFHSMSISSGSTEADSCGNALTGSVFSDRPLIDASGSSLVVYTDSNLTNVFQGGNLKYRLAMSASAGEYDAFDGLFTITQGGGASNYEECGEIFQFYGTTCRLSFEDPCNFPITRTLYTNDFTSIANIQEGDKIYTNSSLTTELADGCRVAISNTYENSGNASRSGTYSLLGGWSNLTTTCPTPTPVPTSTPTPTPTPAPVEAGATEIVGSGATACSSTTTGSLWSDDYTTVTNIQVGDRLYRDSALTQEVTPGGNYIGLTTDTTVGSSPTLYVRYSNTTGVTVVVNCPTPTPTPVPPTPTPTPVSTVTNYFTSVGFDNSSSPCLNTCNTAVYTQGALAVGSIVYTDVSLTTPLAGGFLYWGYGNQGQTSQYALEIDNSGEILSAVACP